MNKKAQNTFYEVIIALVVIGTGLYTVYYAFVHHDMQCNISGQHPGWWCVLGLIFMGLIFAIGGIYVIIYLFRGGRGTPIPQYE
jgi:hypothetical protein